MVDVVLMIIVKILFFVDILENILLNFDENDVENEGENFKCSVILFLVMSFYGMVLWWQKICDGIIEKEKVKREFFV